ncbi:hypothetical protein JL39_00005 [Rhizobium sp. YS-1r]|nr:hypothetical protein JL39_00005 [Rhizobium sp. YS-1r]
MACAADLVRVFRVAEALESGMTGINTGLIPTAEAPFGRVKLVGLGDLGLRCSIEAITKVKYVCVGSVG